MIRHTVVFNLRHETGSAAETAFLEAADVLADIPGVEKFEKLKQVSTKNDYAFGFSMEFASQVAYTTYNEHPWHVAFVKDRWIPEVARFMEIDYVIL
jgi:LAS superfamily LD-carboxypeptidase LdcB